MVKEAPISLNLVPNRGAYDAADPIFLDATTLSKVVVPEASVLLRGSYSRQGPDLLLSGENGEQIYVIGFFAEPNPPDLFTEGGARISAELATKLAGSAAPGQYAQFSPSASSQPIGSVKALTGEVSVTRADGTNLKLGANDPVFQGDVIRTLADGTVGLIFNDNTTISLSEGGRMVLDEFVYDPATETGSSKTSFVQGVFSFVSGKIAKTGDDSMVVETPVASIGIRGTTVAGRAAQEGEQNTIALLRDADGGVGQITISNGAGIQTLTQPGQAVTLTSFTQPPPPPVIIPVQQIQQQFGAAIQTRPQQRTNEEQRREEQRQEQQNPETNTPAPEGEGEAPPDGDTPPEGEGEAPPDGDTPPEGEGEAPPDGDTPPEGEGEAPPDGDSPPPA